MATLIADPGVEQRLIAERRAMGADRKDEVWDGVYIIMPDPNVEHQRLVMRLGVVFSEVVNPPAGGDVFPGLNLSDRGEDWKDNYRCPDVAVFLSGNTAQVFEAHICGPADFLVEIVSPNDKTRDKFDFYGGLGVRELLVIDRQPWSLEMVSPQRQRTSPGGAIECLPERRARQRGPSSELSTVSRPAATGDPHCRNRRRADLDRVKYGCCHRRPMTHVRQSPSSVPGNSMTRYSR